MASKSLYPEPESNRHDRFGSQDFKSCVSTCFTTRAWKNMHAVRRDDKCSIIRCYTNEGIPANDRDLKEDRVAFEPGGVMPRRPAS